MRPKFTVIIPAFNIEKFIERSIKSLVDQSYLNFELLVIDDCSKDKTADVIKKWTKLDHRVKLIQLTHNSGVSVARNTGIQASKGEYLFFLDGDDYLSKDALKLINEKLSYGTDAVIINYDTVDENGEIIKKSKLGFSENTYPNFLIGNEKSLVLLFCGKIDHWNFEVITKKKYFMDNNIRFPIDRQYGEDFATIYKMLSAANKIGFIDEKLYHYVQRSNSKMHQHSIKDSYDYYKTIQEILEFVKLNFPNLIEYAYFYTISRLISAYSIQAQHPKIQNKSFMKQLKNDIIYGIKMTNKLDVKLSFKNKIKVLLIKFNFLTTIYRLRNRKRKN